MGNQFAVELPDQGRKWAHDSEIPEPVTLESLYRDPDCALEVFLSVAPAENSRGVRNQMHSNDHWSIVWQVGSDDPTAWWGGRTRGPRQIVPVYRRIHIVTESAENSKLAKYVYWDARTDHEEGDTPEWKFSLGTYGKANREKLEELALTVPVFDRKAGVRWDSRDWLKDLLEQAVRRGYICRASRDEAVDKAAKV